MGGNLKGGLYEFKLLSLLTQRRHARKTIYRMSILGIGGR